MRALGVSDRLGSIEVGKLADLFIVRGTPLHDIRRTRNVEYVMKGGVIYDAKELLQSVVETLGPRSAAEEGAWKR